MMLFGADLWSVSELQEPPEGEMNALSGNGPKAMRIEEADAAGPDVHTGPFWEIEEGENCWYHITLVICLLVFEYFVLKGEYIMCMYSSDGF